MQRAWQHKSREKNKTMYMIVCTPRLTSLSRGLLLFSCFVLTKVNSIHSISAITGSLFPVLYRSLIFVFDFLRVNYIRSVHDRMFIRLFICGAAFVCIYNKYQVLAFCNLNSHTGKYKYTHTRSHTNTPARTYTRGHTFTLNMYIHMYIRV